MIQTIAYLFRQYFLVNNIICAHEEDWNKAAEEVDVFLRSQSEVIPVTKEMTDAWIDYDPPYLNKEWTFKEINAIRIAFYSGWMAARTWRTDTPKSFPIMGWNEQSGIYLANHAAGKYRDKYWMTLPEKPDE